MKDLRDQIVSLNSEIRHLRLAVEMIPQKLLSSVEHSKLMNLEPKLEHKDILEDTPLCFSLMEQDRSEISQEWQIRRLTAQLTTAYNRIAALEEELLLRRRR